MRTTLTLDDDVAHLVAEAVHRQRRSTKEVINDALRSALGAPGGRPYRTVPHESGLQPGIDTTRLNQLADEMADDELVDGFRG